MARVKINDEIDNESTIQETKDQDITETRIEEEEPAISKEVSLENELQIQKDKYTRLYADFENYKKRVVKDKEELVKYGNEYLIYELLPIIDNLEMAIKHSTNDTSSGIVQGVEITLKEFLKVIERFGVTQVKALDERFDPAVHHAMSQVERDDVDENMVVEEFRKGYMLKDKVLRPSLVAVSKKPVSVNSVSVSEEKPTLNTNAENADTDTNH
jgi:molecular chaperone GrpE